MANAPFVHFVTGKGGVGKTTVAVALALAHRAAGRNVLLAELDGGDRAAAALGVEPAGYALREVRPGLSLVDLTPEGSLKEYVLLIIKVEAVYRMAFENRLVKSFLRLLPALGELTMLGKIWYEWQLRRGPAPKGVVDERGGPPKFDAIVLDLPATGHARAILQAPIAVKQAVPAGPMRENAERIDHMLKHARSSLVITTTADDTPVCEAEELVDFGRARGFARVDVVANKLTESVGAEGVAWGQRLAEADARFAPLGQVLALRNQRAEAGAGYLRRLAARAEPRVRLPSLVRQAGAGHGLQAAQWQQLARRLAPLVGAEAPTASP